MRYFSGSSYHRPVRRIVIVRWLVLALLYGVLGKLGTMFPYIPPSISLIWLPAGIATAALVRWGSIMSPAIFISACILNLSNGISPGYAAIMAMGSTLGPFVIHWDLRRAGFDGDFIHRADVIKFIVASLVGMTIPATVGSVCLWQLGKLPDLKFAWISWWAADIVGVFLATPIILASKKHQFIKMDAQAKENLLFLLIFALTHWLIFCSENSLLHLTFFAMAIMIWSAMRLGSFVTAITVFSSSCFAAIATAYGMGPFQSLERSESSLVLWLYMTTMAITALTINALQAERQVATTKLQEAFERVNKVASRLPGLIMQYRLKQDGSTTVLYASNAVESIFEVSEKEIQHHVEMLVKRIDPIDKKPFLHNLAVATENQTPYQVEFRFHRIDGHIRWLYLDALPELEADGSTLWHCFVSDITDRKKAEEDLRIAAITFESQEGIFVADHEWRILKINQAYTRISGFTPQDLIGKPLPRHENSQQDENFFNGIYQALDHHRFWQGELWAERNDGEVYPQLITLTAVANDEEHITHYIGSFTDISRHKGYEDEILNLAFYDPLTHLPNRRLLMDRLQHLIALNQRDDSHSAILFIDLDNFKTLNDTRGHDAGDLLLIEAAQRLQTCVRESDTVARLGGDEFVVVLQALSPVRDEAARQADRIAEKIRLLLNEPYQITDFVHHGAGSIGVCLFQGGDITVKDLFKRADTAMYEAKTSGRNAVRFFDPAMQAVLVVKMMLESNLRVALALEQFQLYYQIQVDADGKVVGAEALLRWIHPDRGFISPLEFIPLAEQTGLIVPIGTWVLETACMQLKKWSRDPKTAHLSLAVNVSAKQFQQSNFVETVTEIVRLNNIDPSRLKIELTESTILDNVDATTEKMQQLKKLGIAFSMDDFGTGYSSLAYLQKLPLNQLKIDQSFVRDLNDDESDATIVRAIISLGLNLGLDVIAEGVETVAQRRFLIEHNCLTFQGYLYSKPIPIEGLNALLTGDINEHSFFLTPSEADE
ncbi:EAL domain-containing protein [Undibacterium sp. LX40W]|uniref:EAL domain-containing protein n=1 Tax=Undibacterium nitidum TaxID=2762298 RepID=A0A923KLF5_9BURK|nr:MULTISPECIES: EAL domain-containing protein [Undibacterium]MBC3881790.1 EAL domain-containing protein [Undibacterium nitidum]MBC3892213.1 EAL domain-containing protein [Undibacterium sp. LX40W]